MIQPDDVDDLLHEQRIGGEFEGFCPVRFEVEVARDPAGTPQAAGRHPRGALGTCEQRRDRPRQARPAEPMDSTAASVRDYLAN
ncbi:hypothetical protein ACFSKW_34645 [Nonomuraea mangrovi]|uniref:Uncharacterized protein n=1 Tax=Nonomuraea mangrovi TaxID=2316207 RepID=A0ABW4T5W6_9ACTN